MRCYGKAVAMLTVSIAFLLAAGGGAKAATTPQGLWRAYNMALMDQAGPEFGFFDAGGATLSLHQKMDLKFVAGREGIGVTPQRAFFNGWETTVRLEALGRGALLKDVGDGAMRVDGNRVEYLRGGLTEWYLNGPQGLEQGFTLKERPEGSGPLVMAVAFLGDLEPREGQGDVELTRNGLTVLKYSNLYTKDANGRELESRFEVRDGRVLLVVDDAGAKYPIEVDPALSGTWWFESSSTPFSSDPKVENAYFAFGSKAADLDTPTNAIAIDGDTAVIGAPGNGIVGAAYVFSWDWSINLKIAVH